MLGKLYLGVLLMPYGTYHVADKIGRSIRMAAVRRYFRSSIRRTTVPHADCPSQKQTLFKNLQ
jgi:hypothetical protein